MRAWVDLSNLGPGTHDVPVQVQITPHLVRQISQDPEQLTITLDPIVSQVFPVNLVVQGNPPVGYQAQTPMLDPSEVTVTGPESQVSHVKEVRVMVDITNAIRPSSRMKSLYLLDEEGRVVSGLTVSPDTVTITQPITLLGGYRYVIVRRHLGGTGCQWLPIDQYFCLTGWSSRVFHLILSWLIICPDMWRPNPSI